MQGPRYSFDEIHEAYLDCRRRKRGTASALRFEMNLAENLLDLEEELNSGSYRPSRSVCFVNLRPKPREIFAADFRDRVVHHLFVREIEPHWERVFIHDSYRLPPGQGHPPGAGGRCAVSGRMDVRRDAQRHRVRAGRTVLAGTGRRHRG